MDVDAVQLLARVECPHCENGLVMAEDWRAFQEWRSRRPTVSAEAEDDLVEQYFLVVCDYAAVPPMSTECEQCDDGMVAVEVPVRELLEAVLERVDRPVLKATEIDELVDGVKKAISHAAFHSQGLGDGLDMGTWLRAVQEGAEALRSLGELRTKPNGRIV